MMYQAIRNAAKVRHEIMNSFDGLQDTFNEINFVFNMFPHDSNIREAGVDLIVIVLQTVEKTIVFYIKNTLKKMSSALFHGDEYQDGILRGLHDIKLKSEKLSHQGQNSNMLSARQGVAGLNKRSKQVLEQVRTTHLSVSNMENTLAELQAERQAESKRNVEIFNSMFRLLDEAGQAKKENIELRKRQQMLEQTVQWGRTPNPVPATVIRYTLQPEPSVLLQDISAEILWKLVDVPEIETTDLQVVEDTKARIPSVDQGRMEQVVNLNRFKQWIVAPFPDTLLLQDSCRAVRGLTASSIFCSTLFHALKQRQTLCPLMFFCGLHDMDDPYFGGHVMVRSFIAQLLCQWRFDTSRLRSVIDLESLQQNDGATSCQLFSWLVNQLPAEMTVICIIDNIGYYEREAAVEQLVEVVESIRHLMHSPALRTTVKLLATSNTPIRDTRESFSGDSVINLATVTNFEGSSRSRTQRQLSSELNDGHET